jgi:hypothetical protein
MSKLNAFLNPVVTEETQEIVISNRFRDDDGNPSKVTIKSITQGENQNLLKASTHTVKDSKGQYERFDNEEYKNRLVVACTVVPDFSNSDICKNYGTVDPNHVPGQMFLAGEYARLIKAIMDINGYKELEELREEAKNS